jgi:hypothetical protein
MLWGRLRRDHFGVGGDDKPGDRDSNYRAPAHSEPVRMEKRSNEERAQPYDRTSLPRKILNSSDAYAPRICLLVYNIFIYNTFRQKVKRSRGVVLS